MSPLDRHLAPDERVLYRTRLHPVVFAGAVSGAATVLGVVALIVYRNPLPAETVRELWLVGVAVAAASFISPFVRWRRAEFAVTGDRLLLRTGFLRARVVEVPLAEVAAIDVEPSFAGRLFDYATVGVADAAGAAEIVGRVAHAERLRETALRAAPASVRRRMGG